MTRFEIKKNILHKVDEISPFKETDMQWDSLIEGMLDDMANRFLLAIPVYLIIYNTNFIYNKSHGTGRYIDIGLVKIPDNYLRLKYINCKHWKKIITEKDLFTTDSGEYNRQFDIHTRVGIARPKAFLEPIYSTDALSLDKGVHLIVSPFRQNWLLRDLIICYVHRTKAENLQENLLDGFFYFAANALLTSMRQTEFANAMMNKFTEWIQLQTITTQQIHRQ
jgi:hypothetical protein